MCGDLGWVWVDPVCVDVWGTSGEMTKFLAALVSGRAKGKALVNSWDFGPRPVSLTSCTARNRRCPILTSLSEDTEAVRIKCTMALARWSCGTSSVACLVKNRSLPEEKLTP